MRLNLDGKALNEPRIKRIGKRLNISEYEVLGRCCHVWMLCYERRTAFLSIIDADIAAGELPGFVDAMVAVELADLVDENTVRVRGIDERINFLEQQSEKGKISGQRRREMSAELQKRTSVQPGFEFGSTGSSTTSSAEPRTYPLTLSPDQAPDLSPDHPPRPDRSFSADLQNAQNRVRAREVSTLGDDGTQPERTQPRANGELLERPRKQPPTPPAEALMLAGVLMQAVIGNNPSGRLAKSAERLRDQTITRWADSIRKLQEIDKMNWGEIEGMIRWSQRDPFWSGVILGADNLREKWDAMAGQRNRKPSSSQGNVARTGQSASPTELARREVEELERRAALRKENA